VAFPRGLWQFSGMLTLAARCGFFTAALATFACTSSSNSPIDSSSAPGTVGTAVVSAKATNGANEVSARPDAATPSGNSDASTLDASTLDASTPDPATSATTGQSVTSQSAAASTTGTPNATATSEASVHPSSSDRPPSPDPDGGQQPSDGGDAGVTQRIELPAPGSPIAAPEGCEVVLLGESADGCSYHIPCESRTFTSNVKTTGAEWSSCYANSEHLYRFDGIEGPDACAFAANFCINFPATLTSPPVCEVDIDLTPEGTCQHINDCLQPVDLGFGVTAEVLSSSTMLSCFPGLAGSYDCGCSGGVAQDRSWTLTTPNPIDPCDHLQSLCFQDEEFSIGRAAGTDGVCEADPEFITAQQCQITEHCTYTEPYAGDAMLSVIETETAQCVDAGDGWNCDCNASGVRRVRFRPIEEPVPETLCYDALDVCRQPTIEGSGALTCSESIIEDQAEGCETDFECEQPITAGPQEVFNKTSGSVVCDVIPSGWTCSCRYGAEWETLTLDGQLSSSAACSQAAVTCSAKLEL
jgi:hypothetical protein